MSPYSLTGAFDTWTSAAYQRIACLAEPTTLIGPALYRVFFGAAALYQLLINYAQRAFLFGPDAAWPHELFTAQLAAQGSFSLYAWSSTTLWFELVYHAHILVAALWLLGFRTRLLTPLLLAFHWSMHERFGLLWDGGDNMSYLLLFYLCFADVGSRFAPLGRPRRAFDAGNAFHVARGLVHNAAILACVVQICILYMTAGMAKLGGQYWQNGTALYYALRAQEFSVNPGLASFVWNNPYFLVLSTYGTMAFQISFPFVMALGTRLMRIGIVMIAVSFHLGILSGMGLITFGLFMLAYEPLLLRDHELKLIGSLLDVRPIIARSSALFRRTQLKASEGATL